MDTVELAGQLVRGDIAGGPITNQEPLANIRQDFDLISLRLTDFEARHTPVIG